MLQPHYNSIYINTHSRRSYWFSGSTRQRAILLVNVPFQQWIAPKYEETTLKVWLIDLSRVALSDGLQLFLDELTDLHGRSLTALTEPLGFCTWHVENCVNIEVRSSIHITDYAELMNCDFQVGKVKAASCSKHMRHHSAGKELRDIFPFMFD